MAKNPRKPGKPPEPGPNSQPEQLKMLFEECKMNLFFRRRYPDRGRTYLRDVFVPDLTELKDDGASKEIVDFFTFWKDSDVKLQERLRLTRRACRQQKEKAERAKIDEATSRENLAELDKTYWQLYESAPKDMASIGSISFYMLKIIEAEMFGIRAHLSEDHFAPKFPEEKIATEDPEDGPQLPEED